MRKPYANTWMNREITVLEMKWNLMVVATQGTPFLLLKSVSLQILAFFPSPEPIFKAMCVGWNFLCKEKQTASSIFYPNLCSNHCKDPEASAFSNGYQPHTTFTCPI